MKIPLIFPTGILIWSHYIVTIQLSTVTKWNIVAWCYVLLWKPINFVLLIKKCLICSAVEKNSTHNPQLKQRSLWLVEVTVIMEMFKLQRAQNLRKWERWMQLGAPYQYLTTHTTHTHTHISQWSLKLPNERSVLTMTDAAPRYLPLNLSCESLSVVHLFLIVWPLYPMLASFAQGNALSTLCSLILLQLLSSFSTAITSALTVECVNERKKIWVFAALIMWVYIIKLYTFLQQHYSIRNTSKVTVVSFKKYSSISPVRPK